VARGLAGGWALSFDLEAPAGAADGAKATQSKSQSERANGPWLTFLPQDFSLRVFAYCAGIYALACLINGFPFLITDTIRYAGAIPGAPHAQALFNFVMRAPFTLAGFWGLAGASMVATAYTMARLGALAWFKNRAFVFPIIALASVQYIYAGMASTETWAFVCLGLIVAMAATRGFCVLDVALIVLGAVSHMSMSYIAAGALVVAIVLFPKRWAPLVVAGAAVLGANLADKALSAALTHSTAVVRYQHLGAEILCHHYHVYEAYCASNGDNKLCQEPIASFIREKRQIRRELGGFDRDYRPGMGRRFVFGKTSFWSESSDLPREHRLSLEEAERSAKELASYAIRNHPFEIIEAMPAKALTYWRTQPPGAFVSFMTWRGDPHFAPYQAPIDRALVGYDRSLQAHGLLTNGRYLRLNQLAAHLLIVAGLIAPLLLLAMRSFGAMRVALLAAILFVGNFAAVAAFGGVIGRYLERVYPLLGFNAALFCVVFWDQTCAWARQWLVRRSEHASA